jgi:hypothetical protein
MAVLESVRNTSHLPPALNPEFCTSSTTELLEQVPKNFLGKTEEIEAVSSVYGNYAYSVFSIFTETTDRVFFYFCICTVERIGIIFLYFE